MVAVHQRHMPPARVANAQRTRNQLLSRGAGQQIVAAHDIGDMVAGIVDDNRQLIGGNAEFGPHHQVARLGARIKVRAGEELVVDALLRWINA